MATYITVDGGTTNTRLYLVQDRKVTDTLKLSMGLKNGTEALKSNIKVGISTILERNRLLSQDVSQILASGMITSEYGLCKLSHLVSPVGLEELNSSIHETAFQDISEIKWSFIRGVKNSGNTLECADMIRGEETELMGIVNNIKKDALYILPGSHSKHISVDKHGNILEIKTMLSGELFSAVIQHTILKDTTDFEHAQIDEFALKFGFEFCSSHGINETLFKIRVAKNMFGATKENCYCFLMGAILCSEIKSILSSPNSLIVIGGQSHFKQAISILLGIYGNNKEIITLSEDQVTASVALGAVNIYEGTFN